LRIKHDKFLEDRTRDIGEFQITVLSRACAEEFIPVGFSKAIMISIKDKDDPPRNLRFKSRYKAICEVDFADIGKTVIHKDRRYEPINSDDAKQIADFVLSNKRCLDCNRQQLIIHCEAGVSRSAGVAAAIAKYYGDEESAEWFLGERVEPINDIWTSADGSSPFYGNRTVFQEVLNALHLGENNEN